MDRNNLAKKIRYDPHTFVRFQQLPEECEDNTSDLEEVEHVAARVGTTSSFADTQEQQQQQQQHTQQWRRGSCRVIDDDYDDVDVDATLSINTTHDGLSSSSIALSSTDSLASHSTASFNLFNPTDKTSGSSSNINVNSQQPSQLYPVGGLWTSDLDKLLLMGVATCGITKWLQVREEFGFGLHFSSAQLQDRFMLLSADRYERYRSKDENNIESMHTSTCIASARARARTVATEVQEEIVTCTGKKLQLTRKVAAMLASFNEDMVSGSSLLKLLLISV